MAVSRDATCTDIGRASGVTTIDNAYLTIGNVSDRALIAALLVTADATGVTMNWDALGSPQALTQIGARQQIKTWGWYIYLFGLTNPAFGNKTLRASWTTSGTVKFYCTSYKGVEQSSVAAAFLNQVGANGDAGTASRSIVSATGDMVYAVGIANASSLTAPNLNSLWAVANDGFGGAAQDGAGAASVTAQWTTTDVWGINACSIKASGGAPPAGNDAKILLRDRLYA